MRPSAWSGCVEGKNGSFPTAGFNCQATLGSWTEWTFKITAARALKTPKGQQGVLVGTETQSKCQRWKLQARCVDEEQRICAKTGAVSTPERPTFACSCIYLSSTFVIKMIVFLAANPKLRRSVATILPVLRNTISSTSPYLCQESHA